MGKKSKKKTKGKAKGGGTRATGGSRSGSTAAVAGDAGGISTGGASGDYSKLNIIETPPFSSRGGKRHNNNDGPDIFGGKEGKYTRYKKLTRRFKDFLKDALKKTDGLSVSRPSAAADTEDEVVNVELVHDLRDAVDTLYARTCQSQKISPDTSNCAFDPDDTGLDVLDIPPRVIRELNESIRLREEVTAEYERQGKADSTHEYFNQTLKYCQTKLGWTKKVAKFVKKRNQLARAEISAQSEQASVEVATSQMGSFAPFLSEEEDEDDEFEEEGIDDEMIASGQFPELKKPEETEEQRKLRIEEDLIKGSDRFRAWHFLRALDSFMCVVDSHFDELKQAMRGEGELGKMHLQNNDPQMNLLCECTIPVNVGINYIRSMEEDLTADFEHLASFYDILAVVCLPEIIADIEVKIQRKILDNNPTLAKKFVGQVVEMAFHNRNRGNDRKLQSVVSRFAKSSKLPWNDVDQLARQIHMLVSMEVMLRCEEHGNSDLLAVYRRSGDEPHSWLQKMKFYYIGGDRCMLNTQNLVQKITSIFNPRKKLIPKGNMFGPLWDEKSNPARRIRGDMDELLASDILPELLAQASGKGFDRIPAGHELLPLVELLNRQVNEPPSSAIPASITFGVHAILTSIFVMQGDGDIKTLAANANASWHSLFRQLMEDCNPDSGLFIPPHTFLNVAMYSSLSTLPKCTGEPGRVSSEFNAFWNPVQAGTFLSFAIQTCSFGLGSGTIDSFGQLRLTLHLFNALKARGLLDEYTGESIGFLNLLDNSFKRTKAVWVGGRKSEKGDFMKSLLKAWGHSTQEATRQYQERQQQVDGGRNVHGRTPLGPPSSYAGKVRELEPILPEEFSVSFRRLILGDMEGADVEYSVIDRPKGKVDAAQSAFFDYVTSVNAIRDGFDDDEHIVSLNFTKIGGVLTRFICDLSKHMGWHDFIRSIISDEHWQGLRMDRTQMTKFDGSEDALERQAVVHIIARMLGDLDLTPDESLPDETASKVASFMADYFKEAKKTCAFMVKVNSQSLSNYLPSASNPLEGSYPYGRTGRTMMDPLPAFFHYKYQRSGEHKARLIKPGKLTPYEYDGEYTNSPYEQFQRGNVLPQLQNGKRRHIASYKLNELTALGWDGAKYSSCTLKGYWAPFVPGYDSDDDDDYDKIDFRAGKKAGTIGLAPDDVGLYMEIPEKGIVQLNAGK